jgi:hypothetical protein
MADTLTLIAPYVYAILVVMIWSMFLYKDNPLFRIAEASVIGISLGYLAVFAAKYIMDMTINPLLAGSLVAIVPLIIGLLTFARFAPPKYTWLLRIPLAVIIGVGIGLSMRGELEANVRGQLRGLMLPIIGGKFTPLDNIVKLAMVISIIAYFVFSREHTGTWGKLAKMGRYGFMVIMGVYFATVSFGRFTWFSGQVLKILEAIGIAAS